MNMEPLKDCPLCGGMTAFGRDTSSDYENDWEYWIECIHCELLLQHKDRETLIKLWNKRVYDNVK